MSEFILQTAAGGRPVSADALVDVRYRSGSTRSKTPAGICDWEIEGDPEDILAWRYSELEAPGPHDPLLETQPKPYDVTQGQVEGSHYKELGEHQPIEVLKKWLTPEEFRGWVKGEAIVYLARERQKGGDKDLKKADHILRYGMKLMGIE